MILSRESTLRNSIYLTSVVISESSLSESVMMYIENHDVHLNLCTSKKMMYIKKSDVHHWRKYFLSEETENERDESRKWIMNINVKSHAWIWSNIVVLWRRFITQTSWSVSNFMTQTLFHDSFLNKDLFHNHDLFQILWLRSHLMTHFSINVYLIIMICLKSYDSDLILWLIS